MYRYITPLTFIGMGLWYLFSYRKKIPAGKESLGRIMTVAAVVMLLAGLGLLVLTATRD